VRVLLTGASSFTGCWFARKLSVAGHEVTVTHRAASYDGARGRRVALVGAHCRAVHGLAFGDDGFVDLVRHGGFDLLCVHGARVGGYRDPAFDAAAALAENTHRAAEVVPHVPRVLVTGSVFEPGTGKGDATLAAFSSYGLSKAFTAETFRYLCGRHGVSFGRFVIPNPFGPMEEARFTSSLVAAWRRGETPQVRTPDYVRDNIHVSLLSRAYADFAGRLPEGGWTGTLGPSGYREPQGAFAARFAAEIGDRLGIETPLELLEQTDWSEPAVRMNTDEVDAEALGWDEGAAWDELAAWYAR
jgi:nucleoside-diphosphate-sugar epimerase